MNNRTDILFVFVLAAAAVTVATVVAPGTLHLAGRGLAVSVLKWLS